MSSQHKKPPLFVAGKLPTYKGLIVDYRFKQFRSQPADFGEIEFIDFSSERGGKLLFEMIRKNLVPKPILDWLLFG